MIADVSNTESETESDSILETQKMELANNENLKETGLTQEVTKRTSEHNEDYKPEFEHSPFIVEKVQTKEIKGENLPKDSEENELILKETKSLSTEKEVDPADDRQVTDNKDHHNLTNEIDLLPIINKDEAANKMEESQLKEREDRPLVLEERHSLSIAETKKRRASVYCDDNLFIPKELARIEVHKRRYSTSVNTLDQISSNRDYRIRMLKFPVGLGRARYVAQQLRRKKSKERKMRTEMQHGKPTECLEINTTSKTELNLSIKEEPLNMPILNAKQSDKNQLSSKEESSIVLEEIIEEHLTEPEEDGTDELIERVSKRQMRGVSSSELRPSEVNDSQLEMQDHEKLSVFRWHMPNSSDNIIKMGIIEDIQNKSFPANVEIQVGFNELETTTTAAQSEEQIVVMEAAGEPPIANELQQPLQQQPLLSPSLEALEHQPQQQSMNAPQQQYVTAVTSRMPAATSFPQATVPHIDNLPQRAQLINRIILPHVHTNELQTNISNNNAANSINQNVQQHFGKSLMQQWTQQHYENCVQTAAQQQQLPNSLQQQQQQQQTQYQIAYQGTQHLDVRRGELQQLSAQYQRLKSQEDEQLKSINRTLKDVYADRLLSERQHADYHRMFMHKMIESKKQEESLQYQKENIKKKMKEELGNLEQLIGEKRRQLQEHNRTWQWQAEQYNQQQQQQQQQEQQRQLKQLQQQQQQQQEQQHQQQQLQQQQQQHQQQQLQQQQQQHQQQQLQQQQQQLQQQHQLAFNQQQQHPQFLHHLQIPAYQARHHRCFQDGLQTPHIGSTVELHSSHMPPPVVNNRNQRIMRRRHTIDHRANNMMVNANPAPTLQSLTQQNRHSSRRTLSTATSALPTDSQRFALPETSRLSSERNQINRVIDQSAITSIISNYVTNYFNDMESRNPKNI